VRTLPDYLDPIAAAVFSEDNRYALTWSKAGVYSESGGGPTEIGDKTARLWGVPYNDVDAVLAGHNRAINTAAFGPDARFIVTGSEDRTARIWLAAGGEQFAVLRGLQDAIIAVAASPDGSRILTIGSKGRAWLWEPGTTTPARRTFGDLFALHYGLRLPELAGEDQPIELPKLSADGTARLWDASSYKLLKTINAGEGRVLDGAFNSDGSQLATVSRDSMARIWDSRTGDLIHELFGHEGGVVGAVFSPDDSIVATVGDDYTRVWDAATGKQLGAYLGSDPEPLFFARDCSKLVIGAGEENEVRVHPFGACGSQDRLLGSAMDRIRLIGDSARPLP
jgi:WD40 repeat protein